MKVNMNNLRIDLMLSYKHLVNTLNDHIEDGYINISVDEIKREIDDLKCDIGLLACCYKEGDKDMKMVRNEVYMPIFNEEDEESQ